MSQSRIPSSLPSPALPGEPARPSFRGKTIATRLTPEELAEVEAAAKVKGKSLAEWLRDVALRSARQWAADPIALLLAEQMATRYLLLNLFHATAQANGEGWRPQSQYRSAPASPSRSWAMRCDEPFQLGANRRAGY